MKYKDESHEVAESTKSAKYLPLAGVVVLCLLLVASISFAGRLASQQLVIDFAETVSDPEEPKFIEDLSNFSGYPLVYVRPLVGGSHVLRLARPVGEDQMERLIRRLGNRDDVVHVVKDRIASASPRSGQANGK